MKTIEDLLGKQFFKLPEKCILFTTKLAIRKLETIEG
jgi:hypothetical protein